MRKIIEKINELSLLAVILIASIILGWFLYAGIEKQQIIETAQDKKEYMGKKKE